MEAIKKYFSGWDFGRVFRLILGVALGVAYFTTGEQLYLIGAVVLAGMALLNVSCPGGACTTNVPKDDDKQVMTFEEYEPKKDKTNV